MRIAFDAKRAYHNNTGLGNYSRTLISDLAAYFPNNNYFLLNPKKSECYSFEEKQIQEILPKSFVSKKLSSLWRSKWMVKDLTNLNIDLFHGLSHEIPIGIQKSKIKTVVTIHDLIFERFPNQYSPIDVKIYRKKFKYSCLNADRIIAISEQTKDDIVSFYNIDPNKIDVCYQSCDNSFNSSITNTEKKIIARKYNLPERFFLSVGSIIQRKNLLNVCKAMEIMKPDNDIPLIVIGKGRGEYRKVIDDFIAENNLSQQVIFLSETYSVISDLHVIYSLAETLLYPSFFEGFGIPVLEGLSVGIPVITSNTSCLPEAGGDAAFYVNPNVPEEIADSMIRVVNDKLHVQEMIQKGFIHAQKFNNHNCAKKVMETYLNIL